MAALASVYGPLETSRSKSSPPLAISITRYQCVGESKRSIKSMTHTWSLLMRIMLASRVMRSRDVVFLETDLIATTCPVSRCRPGLTTPKPPCRNGQHVWVGGGRGRGEFASRVVHQAKHYQRQKQRTMPMGRLSNRS